MRSTFVCKTLRWPIFYALLGGCSSVSYPKSDHFDGERFYNLDINDRKGLGDLLKWRFTGEKSQWPRWLEIVAQDPPVVPASGDASTTYINHATHLIQIDGLNLLTDPIFSNRASPVSWLGPKRVHKPSMEIDEFKEIQCVLISHNHYDHMDAESIGRLTQKFDPLFIVPLGNERLIRTMGAKRIVELDWWKSTKLEGSDLVVTLVPAQHWSARGLFDRNQALWGGFVIESKTLKIFFAGDTGYNKVFTEIRNRIGVMDLSILPIGAYEPRWFMKNQHMNPDEAVQAHIDLGSRKSLGTHFGTFQLTDEAIDAPVKELAMALEKRSIPFDTFVAPKPGQSHLIQALK